MSKKIELNRRRVLGGIATIGIAAAATGAGTYAYFTDTESSTGNTINAGTLDLSSPSDAQITISKAVPGDSASGTISSTYSGTVNAEIDLDLSLSEPSENSEPASNNTELTASEFAKYLDIDTATVNVGGSSQDLLSSITDANGNGSKDLDDLVSAAPFDSVTGTNAADGDTVSLDLGLTFRTGSGNAAQADGADLTVTLMAQQPNAD